MKLIYPEKQGTPTASSENGNYPVANLVNNVRRKTWRAAAGVQTATLRCPISADADALALFKTNAESAVCTITLDSAEKIFDASPAVNAGGGTVKLQIPGHSMAAGMVILINGTTNYDGVHTLPSQAIGDANNLIITATFFAETPPITATACIVVESETHTLETASRTFTRFWQDYTSQSGAHTATIELTAGAGETVEAGVFKAGSALLFRTPMQPREGRNEYKVSVELNSGGAWGTVLAIVRTFQFTAKLTRNTQFYDLSDVFDVVGTVTPLAWLLVENINDSQWSVLAKFRNEISGSHNHPTRTSTSVSLLEVV